MVSLLDSLVSRQGRTEQVDGDEDDAVPAAREMSSTALTRDFSVLLAS